MKNVILKGSVVVFVLMLLFICMASVSAESNDTTVLTLSKSGITINYPSDWGYSDALSSYSIMAISKADSVDSFGIGQVNINIEKKPIEGEFATFVNNTYAPMQNNNNYDLVSSGSSMIDGNDALEYVYTSNENGVQKQHKAVWFEKGGQAYVLLYSAPIDKFESNLYVFDYILSDIQIT
ncbi:MAG: PsbP-related protein [Methanobrevibacter sp.]|uniref:PsbP-related protein n=1 Tax=uncultured Methanobrevibacter sp. TaxID=253161 RepID=UPI0025E6DE7C|nr:PsbP-related protein [uncultured Methanobrevibacter sp.]MEE1129836.1 PsbP-related protein [Methanobrevibacter sp.]